jgi:hypothetical protein
MRDYNLEACETLDSGLFTGDDFYNKDSLVEFKEYLERWNRRVKEIEEENYSRN